jgi:hypothetical protein
MVSKNIVLSAVLVSAVACSADPLITQVGGGAPPSPSTGKLTGEAEFAAQVAQSGSVGPLETVAGNWHLQGFYVGAYRGCAAVSIYNRDFRRTTHYSVCGAQVQERREIAPSFPSDGDAERIRNGVMSVAWRNGYATQYWDAYQLNGMRIGPPRADGCATIGIMVTYDGMLVQYDEQWVCNR